MQRVRTRNLVRQTRDVGRVVVAMTGLVMAVREDGQMALRVRGGKLWFRTGFVERLAICVKAEILLLRAAQALAAGMALATLVMRLRITLLLELVLLVATVALCVVRLGLTCAAAVLALLNGATLGVNVVQFSIIVVTSAHSVTLDAGRASPFFAIDNRHSAVVTAGCGRRVRLSTAKQTWCRPAAERRKTAEADNVSQLNVSSWVKNTQRRIVGNIC